MADRKPNLRSSIYRSATDGRWHGWVTMDTKEDGSLDRCNQKGPKCRTIYGKNASSWWGGWDSNPGPADYESAALTG
jgi:hypothetical protein